VETLIRGTSQDVEREVLEIIDAFEGEPRLIRFLTQIGAQYMAR
jgi:hypothetical protein